MPHKIVRSASHATRHPKALRRTLARPLSSRAECIMCVCVCVCACVCVRNTCGVACRIWCDDQYCYGQNARVLQQGVRVVCGATTVLLRPERARVTTRGCACRMWCDDRIATADARVLRQGPGPSTTRFQRSPFFSHVLAKLSLGYPGRSVRAEYAT